ncbi:MAG: DUF1801 domain-containing protein [Thermoplasmatota archaeon]
MAPKNVGEYINGLDPWAAEIVSELRRIVIDAIPEVSESIKWAQPVYDVNGPMIFIKAHSKHVNFGFWRGVQLEDPRGLLEGTGEKMRHVKITSGDEIDSEGLRFLIEQAASLNREYGSSAMKKGL